MNAMIRTMYEVLEVCLTVYFDLQDFLLSFKGCLFETIGDIVPCPTVIEKYRSTFTILK
jgi:hypothetical protein